MPTSFAKFSLDFPEVKRTGLGKQLYHQIGRLLKRLLHHGSSGLLKTQKATNVSNFLFGLAELGVQLIPLAA
jgi:hypothetical protein